MADREKHNLMANSNLPKWFLIFKRVWKEVEDEGK